MNSMKSMNSINVAAIQCALSNDTQTNIEKITQWITLAAFEGAHIILPPELFANHYFCKTENEALFELAQEVTGSKFLNHFQSLAARLKVVLPISFFEKDGPHYYNSVAVYDADGSLLGIYRKSHIPDGPGYEEKFFFRPGNSGFKVWSTQYGKIGVGICWDQWFPESARIMTLMGANVLFFPTAIGSEPQDPQLSTKDPWQRAMVGHAVCNAIPIVAANRIGDENGQTFYGNSFICNHRGDLVKEMNSSLEGVIINEINFREIEEYRAAFGFFRDRRPDLYSCLVKA